jgi:hypothetical protein
VSPYPYGEQPLHYAWNDAKCRWLAAAALLAAGVATWLRWPVALAQVDAWALRVAFPAALAIVLAFAPRPTTRVGRIAKDLTVVGLALAPFAGDRIPLLIVCYPLLLAASVVLGETALGARLWHAGD